LRQSGPGREILIDLLRHQPDVIFGWRLEPDGTERISFLGGAANYVGADPSGAGPAGLPLHPEDLPRWQEVRRHSAQGAGAWCFEGRYLTLTGAVRRFACESQAPRRDGVRHGLVFDTTQRKAAEAADRQVKEMRAELVAVKQMASLGQLTAGIAHEIKNPLNFISNFSSISVDLVEELSDLLTEDELGRVEEQIRLLSANLTKIHDHAGRVDAIIRSMLLHAHGGSGARRPTDLNKVVEEARLLAFHGARANDMSFDCHCETQFDGRVGSIDAVPEDLTRVIVNLVSNAVYATEKRRQEDPSDYVPVVQVSTSWRPGMVEIRVEDNGVGILETDRPHLFTPFFTTKPSGEGTGLGLSLSADIIHEHGGTIRYESAGWGGTAFVVTLPAPRSAAPGAAEQKPAPPLHN
jgi:signal transduction histidine kinase